MQDRRISWFSKRFCWKIRDFFFAFFSFSSFKVNSWNQEKKKRKKEKRKKKKSNEDSSKFSSKFFQIFFQISWKWLLGGEEKINGVWSWKRFLVFEGLPNEDLMSQKKKSKWEEFFNQKLLLILSGFQGSWISFFISFEFLLRHYFFSNLQWKEKEKEKKKFFNGESLQFPRQSFSKISKRSRKKIMEIHHQQRRISAIKFSPFSKNYPFFSKNYPFFSLFSSSSS